LDSYYYSGYYYNYSYGSDFANYNLLDNSTLYGIKVPLVRGQLSVGALMFVSSVVYFILYGVTASRARDTSVFPYSTGSVIQ